MDAPPYEQVVIDAPSPLQHETFSTRPTSPMMSYHTNNITHTIPLGRLHMHIELHVATAFVDCSSTWLNTSNEGVILLFVFPLKGTVTGAAVRIGKGRMLETTYIPHEDADKFSKKNSKSDEANGALEAYTPGLFRLPIPRVAAGEQVCVRLTYLEPLRYREGAHHFTSLLDFPHNTVALGPIQNIVSINAIINCLLPGIEYTSDTHDLVCIRSEALRVELAAQFRSTECVSFKFSYSMPCDSVLAALIQQNAPPYSNDPRSSFLLFVSPPSHNMMDFPRDFVIVFDRSGSMTGPPYKESVRALSQACDNMRYTDRFNVVLFDHEELSFSDTLLEANKENFQSVFRWLEKNKPRGGTDIKRPLLNALTFLNSAVETTNHIPIVLLLTDGCVVDERDICREVASQCGSVRILTLGIGAFCNHFFLAMLAHMSRGFSSIVVHEDEIFESVVDLLNQASAPVLRDITLDIKGTTSCEMFPFPVSDLYVGSPLIIAGKYTGSWPSSVTLQARRADGNDFEQIVPTSYTEIIPVDRVYVKQRLDWLMADQWLEQSEDLEQKVIDISCEEGMPTPFTTMVSYETNEKKKHKMTGECMSQSRGANVSRVGLLAVGGVIVLGTTTAFALGNVDATLSNISSLANTIGDNLFDGVNGVLDGECCSCCDGVLDAVTCGSYPSCDTIFETLNCAECVPNLSSCCNATTCGGCCSPIAEVISSLGECCQTLPFQAVGDMCESMCAPCAPIMQVVSVSCGSVFGSIGPICGQLSGVFAVITNTIVSVFDGCDVCVTIDSCCNAISNVGAECVASTENACTDACTQICECMGELTDSADT